MTRQFSPEERLEMKSLIENSGLFDADWYEQRNPDVTGMSMLDHYLDFGGFEGRPASPYFNTAQYLANNPDVAENGIHPLIHYIKYGRDEKRAIEASDLLDVNAHENKERADNFLLIENSDLFDADWYEQRNPDVTGMSMLDHYLDFGGFEGRPASPYFNTAQYLANNPDVAENGTHPLIHYIKYGREEGRFVGLSRQDTLIISEFIDQFGKIEPDIATEPLFEEIPALPVNFSIKNDNVLRCWNNIFGTINTPYNRIVFIPWMNYGGADRVAANLMKVVSDAGLSAETLVVITDFDIENTSDWLPKATNQINIPKAGPSLSSEQRSKIVEMLIFCLMPRTIININSKACWDLLQHKGKAIANITKVFSMLFCRDYNSNGRPAGYADTHLRATIGIQTRLYVDNAAFIKEMIEQYELPNFLANKFRLLYQPIDIFDESPASIGQNKERPRVVWAGRFSPQKNMEILMEIIEMCPYISFDIYGAGSGPYAEGVQERIQQLPNAKLMGSFHFIGDIHLSRYDAMLFTSKWEGVPTTLLHAASVSLPIVASNVGGVGELVDDNTGWPVSEISDPRAYANALQEIISNNEEAAMRSRRMIAKLRTNHSWTSFKNELLSELSPL